MIRARLGLGLGQCFFISCKNIEGKNMFKLILLGLATLATVQATGDLVILHSPDSVTFKGSEEVNQSLLKEICTAALGFTVKQKSTWSGISINDPFHLPEAFVGFAVEGINSLHSPRGKRFPLNVDEVEETTWQALSGRLEERDNDNTLVRIYLGDGLDALGQSALGELKPTAIDESSLKFLSLENEEDRKFLEEVQLLHAIAQKVPSAIHADSIPDVYWLVVSEIRSVLDFHGEESAAAKEALTLLNDALSDVSKAFMDVYENKVLIAAFTNDASQVRHTRSVVLERQTRDTSSNTSSGSGTKIKRSTQIKQTATNNEINTSEKPDQQDDNDEKNAHVTNEDGTKGDATSGDNNNDNFEHDNNPIKHFTEQTTVSTNGAEQAEKSSIDKEVIREIHQLNLSKEYNENYPVIFNILLWFGVVFVFSLLAICIAIADMDPGRDSIIYRMTSNRMKKDN